MKNLIYRVTPICLQSLPHIIKNIPPPPPPPNCDKYILIKWYILLTNILPSFCRAHSTYTRIEGARKNNVNKQSFFVKHVDIIRPDIFFIDNMFQVFSRFSRFKIPPTFLWLIPGFSGFPGLKFQFPGFSR